MHANNWRYPAHHHSSKQQRHTNSFDNGRMIGKGKDYDAFAHFAPLSKHGRKL